MILFISFVIEPIFGDEILDTSAFQDLLINDLIQTVKVHQEKFDELKNRGENRQSRGFTWVLAPMTVLHEKTGDQKYLNLAKSDLLWMVENAIEENGNVTPFLMSFRSLQPFCETYIYL